MSGMRVSETLAQPFTFHTWYTVFTDKFVLGGLFMYALGAIVWLGVLSKWDVSKAYPMVGMGFGLSIVVGFMLGEQITLVRAGGVALICAGVFMVSRS